MQVPQLDLSAQYESLRESIEPRVIQLCASQRFVLGPEVADFETELASYSRVAHAVGCASGTDALTLALLALDVGPGDEVITPSFTFVASAEAIALRGARPVFVDIESQSFNLDPDKLQSAMGPKTKAIVVVDLFGQCANLTEIQSIADQHGIPVIEDAAQSIGAEHRGNRVGEQVAMATLSFYPSKNLGAFGDGGAVLTQNADYAKKLRQLRVHGEVERYVHDIVGMNSRLDAMQAAILRVKLPHLDSWIAKRQAHARTYTELITQYGLQNEIVLPVADVATTRHVYNQYTVRVPQRQALQSYLADHEIGTAVYYPIPQHRQKAFSQGSDLPNLPATDRAASEVLSLPMFPELLPEQLEHVVGCMADFYKCSK